MLGRPFEVYWKGENKWFRGVSQSMTKDGRHNVKYDDGDIRQDNLTGKAEKGKKRKWRYVLSDSPPSSLLPVIKLVLYYSLCLPILPS